jgi:hypothetical protein
MKTVRPPWIAFLASLSARSGYSVHQYSTAPVYKGSEELFLTSPLSQHQSSSWGVGSDQARGPTMAFYDGSYGAAAPYGYGYAAAMPPGAAPYQVPMAGPAAYAVGAVDELRYGFSVHSSDQHALEHQLHAAAWASSTPWHPHTKASVLTLCRTVFVTGFPADVKERELNNMCRFMPGYEASQMYWKNGQVGPGVHRGHVLCASGVHACSNPTLQT